jgi:hypothetical protein
MTESLSGRPSPVQALIEAAMRRHEKEGRWECAFLFSSEGLLLAKSGSSDAYGEDLLLEFSFSLIQTVRLLGGGQPVKEALIRGEGHRKLVFSYFDAWGESMVLAAVVAGAKGHRRADHL